MGIGETNEQDTETVDLIKSLWFNYTYVNKQ